MVLLWDVSIIVKGHLESRSFATTGVESCFDRLPGSDPHPPGQVVHITREARASPLQVWPHGAYPLFHLGSLPDHGYVEAYGPDAGRRYNLDPFIPCRRIDRHAKVFEQRAVSGKIVQPCQRDVWLLLRIGMPGCGYLEHSESGPCIGDRVQIFIRKVNCDFDDCGLRPAAYSRNHEVFHFVTLEERAEPVHGEVDEINSKHDLQEEYEIQANRV